jgi:rfaE bifunctional protein kinase chain/domain
MDNKQKTALNKYKDRKIVVWGDFILDEFVYTRSERISREAPVLITEYISSKLFPGGAGNVIMNLKSLNAVPVPVGFVGNDNDGNKLLSIFKNNGISTEGLIKVDNLKTPKKSRIFSGGDNTKKQQVLRIDTKNHNRPVKDDYQKLLKRIEALLHRSGLLIVSDYLNESVNPDIFNKLITKMPKITSVIDSRQNLLNYKNGTIITPNEPEMKNLFPDNQFLTDNDYNRAGKELLVSMNVKGIVFKRGHKGMIVFSNEHPPQKIDIFGPSSIVDVTGAGDSVISVLSLSIQSGLSLYDSADLANIAGGIVVMHEGTYPIKFDELYNAVK